MSRIEWQIRDSAWAPPWDPMDDSITVYRIVARRGSVSDTIADVIGPWPVVTSDSTIVGLRMVRRDSTREMFELRLPSRRTIPHRLPRDLFFNLTDVAVSPDGRFLAYVADSSSGPYAAIRMLDGPLLLRGHVQGGCDCDVDMNHARWVTPDSFEVAVVNSANPTKGAPWTLFAGSVRGRRSRESGLSREPTWHDSSRP